MSMAELDSMIRAVSSLPELMVDVLPDVAKAVEADIMRTVNAGTAPDGVPWAPRKADGSRPLEAAADAIGVAVVGKSILVRVRGINAAHHMGRVRGRVSRQLIPVESLPPAMVTAMCAAIVKRFDRKVSSG